MALTGNVNYATYFEGSVSLPPLETGWGQSVIPTTDASGIQLQIGDTIRFTNPTPGQNGLANTPILVGVIVAFGGSLLTANVPSVTQLSTAIAVYNIPCNQCYQIYSTQVGNMESTPTQ